MYPRIINNHKSVGIVSVCKFYSWIPKFIGNYQQSQNY